MKYGTIRNKKHYVFESRKEFEEWFMHNEGAVPKLVPWRDAQKGDWVEADDGGIVQVVKRGEIRHPHDTKNYKSHSGYVRTVVGTFLCNNKTEMDTDFDKHPSRYTFNGKATPDRRRRRRERKELSKSDRIFAWELATGKTLQRAYESAFTPKTNWREDAVMLLKTKRIQSEIMKTIKEIADELGITHEYVLTNLKEIVDHEGGSVRLGAVKEIAEIIGTKGEPQKGVQQLEMYQGFSLEDADVEAIEEDKVKTLAEG